MAFRAVFCDDRVELLYIDCYRSSSSLTVIIVRIIEEFLSETLLIPFLESR